MAALSAGAVPGDALARDGVGMIGIGDMGIGNTTASSALAAVFTGTPPEEVTGRGTGIDDADAPTQGRRRAARARGEPTRSHGRGRRAGEGGRLRDRRPGRRRAGRRRGARAGRRRRFHRERRGAGCRAPRAERGGVLDRVPPLRRGRAPPRVAGAWARCRSSISICASAKARAPRWRCCWSTPRSRSRPRWRRSNRPASATRPQSASRPRS